MSRSTDWRRVALLVGATAVLWLLWNTWMVYPIKLLVVFFHELSHGLAALLTGGRILRIEIVPRQGGVCWTAGGSPFLILSAGYLGSVVWGGALLLFSLRTRHDRVVTVLLGTLLAAVALVWIRPILGFGFFFASLSGLALVAIALHLPARVNEGLLGLVGLTSILYAAFDIKSDILDRPHLLESDAAALARLTGIPTVVWGLLWLGMAVAAGAWFVRVACRHAP